MVYLLNMVIFHRELLNKQMVVGFHWMNQPTNMFNTPGDRLRIHSLDWFKGKFTSEPPIFNGKNHGFL